jgi:hypothetical protein
MIIMLTDLPDDIQGVIISKLDRITFVVLCHVDKKYHRMVSSSDRTQKINRILECHNIASYGHLEVLKWVRENGCEWDMYVCYIAYKNRHLEILQWARKNGCPWNFGTARKAEKKWPEIFT